MHKPYTAKDKWIVAIIAGLLFLLISSPFFFSIINKFTSFAFFGLNTTDSSGAPNLIGLVLHSLIFIIIVRTLMR